MAALGFSNMVHGMMEVPGNLTPAHTVYIDPPVVLINFVLHGFIALSDALRQVDAIFLFKLALYKFAIKSRKAATLPRILP